MIKGKFLSRASMMTPLTKEEERLLENYDIDPEALKSVLGVSALKHSDKKSLARAPLTEPTCTIDGLPATREMAQKPSLLRVRLQTGF